MLVSGKRIIAIVVTITSVIVFTFVLMKSLHSSPDDIDRLSAQTYSADDYVRVQTNSNSNTNSSTVASTKTGSSIDVPITLKIPRISVDANIQHVGISKRGNMAVPTNYTDVGWYRNGPRPGEVGTAVINGHLDNAFGLKGVFWDLPDLVKGDEIVVVTHSGEKITFEVTRTDEFDYNDPKASDFVFKNESKPTIRLITCSGDWISSEKTYDKRLVVTAVRK